MVTAEELERRRGEVTAHRDLAALLDRLTSRAAPVLDRLPPIPESKALLSSDGGVCPHDGAALIFDPWSPTKHRCPRCAREHPGERHDRAWARLQHLWLAERTAHLAAVAVLGDNSRAAARANELLTYYGTHYLDYPNQDNVLGPGRLFYSTYMESIWLCNYLAAAHLLREAELLDAETAGAVATLADEAANLIGEFEEGFSNRQTWHNAALAAVAVWFEDEELARGVVERETGLIAHLMQGFGNDGMWYEGENYHLFALRGQLLGMDWARLAGVDLLEDPRLAARVEAALRAPALTALPDFTFPARKDSRFAVSLAQPMYLELWEIGLAQLDRDNLDRGELDRTDAGGADIARGDPGRRAAELWSWLRELYDAPAPEAQLFDSYLHEAGEPAPTRPRTRADLSWWALLGMAPELPDSARPWSPGSALLAEQGLAILRTGGRYLSLETGPYGGGHGHPDRLHLTLHADGVHWLADFGTGSYVSRDLFWYRSTLAHNAPQLDSVSQPPGDAVCEHFDTADGDTARDSTAADSTAADGAAGNSTADGWAWTRGRYGDLTRTVVSGPTYVLDIVELTGAEERLFELPWHIAGRSEVSTRGTWCPDQLNSEFVSQVERLAREGASDVSSDVSYLIRSTHEGAAGAIASLTAHVLFDGDLLRALAPAAPGTRELATFYVLRALGRNIRCVTVLEATAGVPQVRAVRATGDMVEVETTAGVDRHVPTADGWEVHTPQEAVKLRGRREPRKPFTPLLFQDRPARPHALAPQLHEPPLLDGTLEGFDGGEPLTLDYDDQYRRAEEPYPGPEEFSAMAYVNWTDEALYIGVDVVKPNLVIRPPDAPPLRLDNDPDDIHADGIQAYLRVSEDGPVYGFLIVPSDETGAVRVHGASDTHGHPDMVHGAWQPTDAGYCITASIAIPEWSDIHRGAHLDFDLLINRMDPDRLRRSGQLVWSGGAGWVWLRGDRQPPSRFGVLELQ